MVKLCFCAVELVSLPLTFWRDFSRSRKTAVVSISSGMWKSQNSDTHGYEILPDDVFCKIKDRYQLGYSLKMLAVFFLSLSNLRLTCCPSANLLCFMCFIRHCVAILWWNIFANKGKLAYISYHQLNCHCMSCGTTSWTTSSVRMQDKIQSLPWQMTWRGWTERVRVVVTYVTFQVRIVILGSYDN